jgi:hypothetical protein
MTAADGYFGESVAATYDESSDRMFDRAVVEPTVDFLAELAGMRLREHWSGWGREPFTSDSRQHVSVWEKPT